MRPRRDLVTRDDLRAVLQAEVDVDGVSAVARRLGVSPAYVSVVLRRPDLQGIGPKLSKAMGYRAVVMYEKVG